MDENWFIPDEFDSACRQHLPRAVYLILTIHNPTTATMPLSRRKEVAEIVRRHEVLIVEGLKAEKPVLLPSWAQVLEAFISGADAM